MISLKKYLFNLRHTDHEVVSQVAASFENNKRITQMVGSIEKSNQGAVFTLVAYAYLKVKKMGGIFTSSGNTSFIFFYRNSEFFQSWKDWMRYLYLAVFVLDWSKVQGIIKREKAVKKIRTADQKKNGFKDFLYVWFLAQARSYNSLDALMEVKRFIVGKSDYLNIPIYMETTETRLVPMYARMGFKFYDSYHETDADYTIYFAKYTPFLEQMKQKLAA